MEEIRCKSKFSPALVARRKSKEAAVRELRGGDRRSKYVRKSSWSIYQESCMALTGRKLESYEAIFSAELATWVHFIH